MKITNKKRNNSGNISVVHTDYLGTPRYVTDSSNNVLWKWENLDPYGSNAAVGTLEFNLRFAGQYYDNESGLHYNMFRTYDPSSKRYMQSDPMGLNAGWNTYNYVGRNPLNGVDPLGLDLVDFGLKQYNKQTSSIFSLLSMFLFDVESSVKSSYGNFDPYSLYLLGHGSTNTLGGNNGHDLSSQIINGNFRVKSGISFKYIQYKDDYFQRMIKQKKNILIIMDACNTGSKNIDGSPNIQDIVGMDLRNYLDQNNLRDIKITILAPDGLASMNDVNPLNDSISGNGKWIKKVY